MSKNKKSNFLLVYGYNSVKELLKNGQQNILEFYVSSDKKHPQNILDKVRDYAQRFQVKIKYVDLNFFKKNFGLSVKHQGIAVKIESFKYCDYSLWEQSSKNKENELVLLLDKIEDPRNFGAIIRTAAAVGVSAIFVPSYGQSPVTDTVFSTSTGNIFKVNIIQVSNINNTIEKIKKLGFWTYALDMGKKSEENLFRQKLDKKTAFVLGSEGEGVSPKTVNNCDFITSIPMENNVESLNVSVSAAVVMYEWKRQYLKKN